MTNKNNSNKNNNNKTKNIAFLLLTYDDHNKAEEIKKFIENGNIYVHSKNPSLVTSYLKDYIIEENVKTEWGELSIVEAELALLKEAYKNTKNKWFVLLSGSCYPLKNFLFFKNDINQINLSFFNMTSVFLISNKNYYKSSQFWILKRDDVETILHHMQKYINLFKNNKDVRKYGAYDELFFLTLLINEKGLGNFKYNDCQSTYSKWINLTSNPHPFVLNRLTPNDKEILNKNNSLFFRKVSQTFTCEFKKLNNKLIILFIDKSSLNNKDMEIINNIYINYDNNICDVILFFSTYAEKVIPKELLKISVCYINIIYSLFNMSYAIFNLKNPDYFNQWSNIEIIKFI
jgi:hypothetical protein